MNQITQLWTDLLQWATGSTAAGVSFAINVIALGLTVWSFWMYFGQKREYRLLFGMLQEFDVEQKLKAAKSRAEQDHERAKEELQKAKQSIQVAEAELKEKLPLAARRAYYENTIPVLQQQIYDLSEQLRTMQAGLGEVASVGDLKSPEITQILTDEIQQFLLIRQQIERGQTLLSVYSAGAAAVSILFPYPLSLLAIPLGAAIAFEGAKLYRLSKRYYLWRHGTAAPKHAVRRTTPRVDL